MTSQQKQKQGHGRKVSYGARETRHLLLQAAQQMFSTYGYRAVSTKQIAEACGITQPALYKHFTDKQDLYAAMVVEMLAHVKTALERIVYRSLPVSERLRLVAVYLLTTTQQDLMMMSHDIKYELSSEVQGQLQRTFSEAVIMPLATIFEEGMHQKVLRSPVEGGTTASTAAFLFLNLASTLTLQSLGSASVPSLTSVAERAQLVVNFTLRGLGLPI